MRFARRVPLDHNQKRRNLNGFDANIPESHVPPEVGIFVDPDFKASPHLHGFDLKFSSISERLVTAPDGNA
jgi:hypothetical protein